MKNQSILIVAVWIILEIFFVSNIKLSHEIGDDFAMYLQQSKNIYEGKTQSDNYYIYNPNNASYAPKSYSIGFPLLLSPMWVFQGNELWGAKFILIQCFLMMLLITFLFYRKEKNSPLVSIGAVFILGGWLYVKDFESQILADIPLMMWGGLILYFQESSSKITKGIFVLAFFFAMAYLTKSIGLCYLVGFIIFETWKVLKKWDKRRMLQLLQIIFLFVSYCFFVNIILKQDNFDLSHFYALIKSELNSHLILENLMTYKNEGLAIVGTLGPKSVNGISRIFSYLFLGSVGYGLVFSVKEGKSRILFLTIILLIAIIIFPNFQQGYRYLLPLIPILFYYGFVISSSVSIYSKRAIFILMVSILILIFLSLNKKDKSFAAFNEQNKILFEKVKSQTLETDRILFYKPRLLGYATHRAAGYVSQKNTKEEVNAFLNQEKIKTIILTKSENEENIKKVLFDSNLTWKLIDTTEVYLIYKSGE